MRKRSDSRVTDEKSAKPKSPASIRNSKIRTSSVHSPVVVKSLSKSPSKNIITKTPNPIQRVYTKSTYLRSQQKINICTKIQQLFSQIEERQAKMHSYFQIYKILQSETGRQRCLQHNNDLSLYCETCGKILCVHCIYGSSKHKTHKVYPLKDSISIKCVTSDVQRMHEDVDRQLEHIRTQIRLIDRNSATIQEFYKKQLQQIEKTYNEKLHEIEVEFCEKKKHVSEYFDEIVEENGKLLNKMHTFESSLLENISYVNKNTKTSDTGTGSVNKQVSKHKMLSKVRELSSLKGVLFDSMTEKELGLNNPRSRSVSPKPRLDFK